MQLKRSLAIILPTFNHDYCFVWSIVQVATPKLPCVAVNTHVPVNVPFVSESVVLPPVPSHVRVPSAGGGGAAIELIEPLLIENGAVPESVIFVPKKVFCAGLFGLFDTNDICASLADVPVIFIAVTQVAAAFFL